MRGFDRAEVTDYIQRLHNEIDSLRDQMNQAHQSALTGDAERDRLAGEVTQLREEVERLSGPIESVENMSDRIARMMRVASDEAHRTKEMAREEAAMLTTKLNEEIEAARKEVEGARQDRATANAALAEFQAVTAARREEILTEARTEAEEVLQAAYAESARLIEEAENAARVRRETDEKWRRDAQKRLDQQIKAAWEQAEKHAANLEKDARLKATDLVTAAESEARLITERTQSDIKLLHEERAGLLTALAEIQGRVEDTLRRSRISVVKDAPDSEQFGDVDEVEVEEARAEQA
ncbi:hypothetical protein A5643_06695 [Mycobacterium sp. 1274756.6]|nr:hypothetical protein A5643_06695 [Mycobacterium sp. 1274756.6]